MRPLLFFMIILFTAEIGYGQDSKVTTGMIKFDQGDYQGAIKALEKAVEDVSALKEKNVFKAWLYLSDSYVRLASDPSHSANQNELLMKGNEAYKMAIGANTGDKLLQSKLEILREYLFTGLFNLSAETYNNQQYKEALTIVKESIQVDPDNHLGWLMAGQYLIAQNNYEAAYENLVKAEERLDLLPGEAPEDNIAWLYSALGNLALNFRDDPNKAVSYTRKGLEYFPEDQDIKLNMLSAYQQLPERIDECRADFESGIRLDPGNLAIRNAWAGLLLAAGEVEKGLNQSTEVLKADPNDLQANYNLGSYYINRAASYSEAAQNADINEYEGYQNKVKENLSMGYPYMIKLHELQPGERQWLSQLLSISSIVEEYQDEFSKWNGKLKALDK